MSVNLNFIEDLLKNEFPDSNIQLVDDRGDGYHLSLYIESEKFDGLKKIDCHKMIYKVLKDYINEIHALSIEIKAKRVK